MAIGRLFSPGLIIDAKRRSNVRLVSAQLFGQENGVISDNGCETGVTVEVDTVVRFIPDIGSR